MAVVAHPCLQIEQGLQNFNYFISFQDHKQKGIIEPVDPFKRNSFRTNFGARPTEKLTVDLSAVEAVTTH